MKALILAGGFARRLAPITDFIAKPLLPVGERLIIDWIVDNIKNAGIDEIIVSTNSYYERQFRYWIKCRNDDISLLIEPTRKEEEKFGAIKGIKYAMDKYGQDDYLIVAGDNYFDFSLSQFLKFYEDRKSPIVAVYDVEYRDKARRYGVVSVDNEGKITKFVEKPENPESTLIATACYVFPKEVYGLLKDYLDNKNNPDSPGYFISWLITKIPVYTFSFKGTWLDIGNLDEYRRAFSMF